MNNDIHDQSKGLDTGGGGLRPPRTERALNRLETGIIGAQAPRTVTVCTDCETYTKDTHDEWTHCPFCGSEALITATEP